MLLAELVDVSLQVSRIRARLQKVSLLSGLLRALGPDEVALGVTYLSGAIPQGRIGVGYALVRQLAELPPASERSLTLRDVDAALTRFPTLVGAGSAGARRALLGELFARGTLDEQRFLGKLLVGELRQGALEGLMAEAIAGAASVSAAAVRRALMFSDDLGAVAKAAWVEKEAGLARFRLELMRPIQPMLAQTAADVAEALGALGSAALEYKLDGARVQVHRDGETVRVYSRDGNEVTAAVPEVVEAALALPGRALVLDGEALALRPDGRPRPFQETMRRFGRKLDVASARGQLPLHAFFFDVLHLDGQDLFDRPFEERAYALDALVPEVARIPRRVGPTPEEAEAFYACALERGHEGLLAKGLGAAYEAGRRGASWLKIKPAHTLDLVVLAAEWGSGRREGFLSNLHLGARDPATGGFVMLGKTFKGMTDAMLAWQTTWFLEHEVGRDASTVHVRPELVAEVAFDGLQASTQYPGGVALRFARIKRYREDKRADAADTLEAVLQLHRRAAGR